MELYLYAFVGNLWSFLTSCLELNVFSMPLLKVQLNHPGKEKPFRIGKGYHNDGNRIIRQWNIDSKHYRKFIRCEGQYLTNVKSKPQNAPLYFWGEWEGHSIFTPLESERPNGVHEPFHYLENVGKMNTDPYVYGTDFKYATCMQTGKLKDLSPDSLVFFGTTTDQGFELDTVFVVKSHETAERVFNTSAALYSGTYMEQTLARLGETYLGPKYSSYKKIYRSITWWDNPNYFSFVPCRLDYKKKTYQSSFTNTSIFKTKSGSSFISFRKMESLKLMGLGG